MDSKITKLFHGLAGNNNISLEMIINFVQFKSIKTSVLFKNAVVQFSLERRGEIALDL